MHKLLILVVLLALASLAAACQQTTTPNATTQPTPVAMTMPTPTPRPFVGLTLCKVEIKNKVGVLANPDEMKQSLQGSLQALGFAFEPHNCAGHPRVVVTVEETERWEHRGDPDEWAGFTIHEIAFRPPTKLAQAFLQTWQETHTRPFLPDIKPKVSVGGNIASMAGAHTEARLLAKTLFEKFVITYADEFARQAKVPQRGIDFSKLTPPH